MRIVLMGTGHIGHRIASLLSGSRDFEVKVMDRSAAALKRLQGLPVETCQIDTSDTDALRQSLAGCDTVVTALPYYLATTIARPALVAGCRLPLL